VQRVRGPRRGSWVRGEVARVRGEVARVRGEVARVRGEVARVRGEVARVRGETMTLPVKITMVMRYLPPRNCHGLDDRAAWHVPAAVRQAYVALGAS
jgi:hypothetical protein